MKKIHKSKKESTKDLFENDLKTVLNILEKLCKGEVDHIDYVKCRKKFIDTWAPK
jgi:hypothetical protein